MSSLLSNSDSWIGITKEHIERLQSVQDNYFMKVFQVADKGTPVCMVRLDSQTLQVKWQILLKKMKQVRKTMDKDEENICKKIEIRKKQNKPLKITISKLKDERNRLITELDEQQNEVKIELLNKAIADEEAEENRKDIVENFHELGENPENILRSRKCGN